MKNSIIIGLCIIVLSTVCVSCDRSGADVSVEEIKVDSMELYVGKSAQMVFSVIPEGAVYDDVFFACEDRSVVRVDQSGTVTALSEGKTSLTVSAGGRTGVGTVTVLPAVVEEIVIDTTDISIEIGNEVQLNASVSPEYAENYSILWESDNEGVAKVNEHGLVTALAEGIAVIKASVGDVFDEIKVQVTKITPKVGDFFYSDGTFSTDLQEDKEVIGLVFWSGDPGKDDKALREDHPECVNGLVVALDNAGDDMVAWQMNYTDYGRTVGEWVEENTEYASITTSDGIDQPLNKIVGYNNTKAMELFNADKANSNWSLGVIDAMYSWTVQAPENTSGWYVPSAKELSLLCSGDYDDDIMYMPRDMMDVKNKINDVLVKIGKPSINGDYWSSSELDYSFAIICGFFSAMVASEYKNEYWACCVRPVLAF